MANRANRLRKKFLSKIFRSKTAEKHLQTVGGPAAIQALETALEPMIGAKNRYQTFQSFLRMDPELNNAVTRLALLVQFAYKGAYVNVGKDLTDEEKTLQKNVQKAAKEFRFRERFYYIARHLFRDGDEVFVTHLEDDVGIRQIQPLPITKLTGVAKKEQAGKTDETIQGPAKFYVLNEGLADKQQIFPQNEKQTVYHVALDNFAEEITDNMGRYTFGVWSESPLEALRSRVLWKQAILIADILWRYKNVPREVHELDLSAITLEQFEGNTIQDRMSAYQTAIQNLLKAYAKEIQKKKVDQGYVVPMGTRIYYTEPSKVTYTSPNELMDQINKSIEKGLSAYDVEAGTYATALIVSSYVVLLPDLVASKIKDALLEILKNHMQKKFNVSEGDLEKIDLRIALTLDIFQGELVRQMALVAATGTQTLDELRKMVGKDPLTDEQIKRLVDISVKGGREGQFAQTLFDMIRDADRRQEPEIVTPQSRRDRQAT